MNVICGGPVCRVCRVVRVCCCSVVVAAACCPNIIQHGTETRAEMRAEMVTKLYGIQRALYRVGSGIRAHSNCACVFTHYAAIHSSFK